MNKVIIHDIIGRAYAVYNELGYGFLENVYENSLAFELDSIERPTNQQCKIDVYYRMKKVGFYIPDMIVEDKVIVELKTCAEITSSHRLQLQNYLKATGLESGIILNFSPDGLFYKKVMHP